MPGVSSLEVVIVDYGLGNLFSVKHACERTGLRTVITSSKKALFKTDAIVLPGVGAFGDAMSSLRTLDLVEPLKDMIFSGKPLMGICLGMQLIMTKSYEFGEHEGLGVIAGIVKPFKSPREGLERLKVPHLGWNRVFKTDNKWTGSPLDGLADGEFMYFVHSFYAEPEDAGLVLAVSEYGETRFCSSFVSGNIFGCQFHPERSGPQGLKIYERFADLIKTHKMETIGENAGIKG